MKHDKISIIIPVYNVEKYLKKCLDSCVNQTYDNIEIICINDCSTDSSGLILKEYEDKNFIKLKTFNQNHGVSFARNFGLDSISLDSKYITFVDSDDFIDKTFCEKLFNNIQLSDLSCCGNNNVSQDYKIIKQFHIPNLGWSNHPLKDRKHFSIYPTVSKKLFKTDIIKKYNLRFSTELNYAEDALFFIQYLTHCESISAVQEPLYNVVLNPLSLCRNPKYKARRSANGAKVRALTSQIEQRYCKEI